MSGHKHATGAAQAKEKTKDVADLLKSLDDSCSAERACQKVAHFLHVNRNEVALLRVEGGSLKFIYPVELRAAGAIPISGSSVAARTAATRTPLLSNTFARVKHVSLFETVKLSNSADNSQPEQMPIQKIMSVPIVDKESVVLGVIQISRKGLDSSLAGADFSNDDLKQLELVAEVIAQLPFMKENTAI